MIREFGLIDVIYLLGAARWTVALAAVAFLGGGLVGLVVALLRVTPLAPLRWLAIVYIQAIQGTPLLAWLFVFYFGLPLVGLVGRPVDRGGDGASRSMPAPSSARSGAARCSDPARRNGRRAPRSASASLEQLRYIIVPQAVRIAIPPTVGFLVQLIKNTSLAAVIGFVELTREGQITNASTFRPFTVYLIVAAIYFAICFPLTQWSRCLERRLHVAR